jgi:hypothetical protein
VNSSRHLSQSHLRQSSSSKVSQFNGSSSARAGAAAVVVVPLKSSQLESITERHRPFKDVGISSSSEKPSRKLLTSASKKVGRVLKKSSYRKDHPQASEPKTTSSSQKVRITAGKRENITEENKNPNEPQLHQ